MIRGMWRRLAAVLLIFGWVSLSGFDVLEDLGGVSGQAKLSSVSANALRANSHKSSSLANNIVESANLIKRSYLALVDFMPILLGSDTLLEFRRHSQLHKLHRVFLI